MPVYRGVSLIWTGPSPFWSEQIATCSSVVSRAISSVSLVFCASNVKWPPSASRASSVRLASSSDRPNWSSSGSLSTPPRSASGGTPYPFILLNLAFSAQAAYAAPLILLAQTRQAERDKLRDAAIQEHHDADIQRERAFEDRQTEVLRREQARNGRCRTLRRGRTGPADRMTRDLLLDSSEKAPRTESHESDLPGQRLSKDHRARRSSRVSAGPVADRSKCQTVCN